MTASSRTPKKPDWPEGVEEQQKRDAENAMKNVGWALTPACPCLFPDCVGDPQTACHGRTEPCK